jgi:hypothetical protein
MNLKDPNISLWSLRDPTVGRFESFEEIYFKVWTIHLTNYICTILLISQAKSTLISFFKSKRERQKTC